MTSSVFLDSQVLDYQQLAENVTPNSEFVIFDTTQDGIAQITQVLTGRSNLRRYSDCLSW
ncbi:MAG: DUF4347 domain-containing protein [Oscillatoria sp. PMC 1051.18]|nr:DUF4347 domain-containing protein [Oscillatoria sp. PMC 1050.18]MEC5029298.1 DUF4347 domain-containing protein [Oscillatoria sp. PMC 1051.18]